MQALHPQEDRRSAAIAKLAEVSKHLQASAAAVTNRLVRLAGNDYASPQKAIASLAVYQNSGLLCADEVLEAEALLRGEPLTATAERNRERQGRDTVTAARQVLHGEGFIEIPGSTEKARVLARFIILELGRMSEAELDALHDELAERRKVKPRNRRVGPRQKRAAPASFFRVIEGGCGQ